MRVRLRLADSAPLIWRTLDIDPSTPLDVMHLVLQRLPPAELRKMGQQFGSATPIQGD